MNYAVSIRQPISVLKTAEEIVAEYKDYKGLFEKIKELPDKKFILRLPLSEYLTGDWRAIQAFAMDSNFLLCVEQPTEYVINKCAELNISFFWGKKLTSYNEVNLALAAGVSELLLGAPLCFDLPTVKRNGLPIRLVANECLPAGDIRESGCTGEYIRPEDVGVYEQYVSTIEFKTNKLEQEAELLKIYKRGAWPGNLNLLLTNLKENADNRIFPPDFGEIRTKCKQKCMELEGRCHYCITNVKFNAVLRKNYKDWEIGKGWKKEEE